MFYWRMVLVTLDSVVTIATYTKYSQLGSYTTLGQLYIPRSGSYTMAGNHSTSQLDYDLVVAYYSSTLVADS